MDTDIARPIPGDHVRIVTNSWTEPYWKAAQEERLVVAQCTQCRTHRMPPHPFCAECQSQDTAYPTMAGTATVYSFAICHQSPFPDVANFTYVPAVVEIDGAPGVRIMTNIVDVRAGEVKIGMRLKVGFHPISDGWKWPIFRPLT